MPAHSHKCFRKNLRLRSAIRHSFGAFGSPQLWLRFLAGPISLALVKQIIRLQQFLPSTLCQYNNAPQFLPQKNFEISGFRNDFKLTFHDAITNCFKKLSIVKVNSFYTIKINKQYFLQISTTQWISSNAAIYFRGDKTIWQKDSELKRGIAGVLLLFKGKLRFQEETVWWDLADVEGLFEMKICSSIYQNKWFCDY